MFVAFRPAHSNHDHNPQSTVFQIRLSSENIRFHNSVIKLTLLGTVVDKRLKTGLVLVNACRFLLSPIEGQRYRLTLCGLNTFNAAFVMSCLPVCNNTRTLDKLSLRYILEDSVRHGHTFRCWLKHGNNDWPIYIYACIRVWLAKCLSVRKVVRRENADGTQTHFLNRTHIFWTKLENNLRTELEHIFLTELKTHFFNRTRTQFTNRTETHFMNRTQNTFYEQNSNTLY